MKKTSQKIISVILAITMIFSGTAFVFAADEAADNSAIIKTAGLLDGILSAVFRGFGALFPKDFETVEEYKKGNYNSAAKYMAKSLELVDFTIGCGVLFEHAGDIEKKRNNFKKFFTSAFSYHFNNNITYVLMLY